MTTKTGSDSPNHMSAPNRLAPASTPLRDLVGPPDSQRGRQRPSRDLINAKCTRFDGVCDTRSTWMRGSGCGGRQSRKEPQTMDEFALHWATGPPVSEPITNESQEYSRGVPRVDDLTNHWSSTCCERVVQSLSLWSSLAGVLGTYKESLNHLCRERLQSPQTQVRPYRIVRTRCSGRRPEDRRHECYVGIRKSHRQIRRRARETQSRTPRSIRTISIPLHLTRV